MFTWIRKRLQARRTRIEWAKVEAVSCTYVPNELKLPANKMEGWQRIARILEEHRTPGAYAALDLLMQQGTFNRRQLAALLTLVKIVLKSR